MLNQHYQDLTFVFGAPSGKRYEMLREISDERQTSFSEIFFEYLDDVFTKTVEGDLLNKTFSSAFGKEIEIGDYHFDYQYWHKEKDAFQKFLQNKKGGLIRIPSLMVFPENFVSPLKTKIDTVVEMEHANYVAAVIGKSLQLDWVQTSCASKFKKT
jgi:hypothetical protein